MIMEEIVTEETFSGGKVFFFMCEQNNIIYEER